MEPKKVMSEQDLKINELEQYSKKNCVIINGVPEAPDESALGLVMEIGRLIDVEILPTDIDNVHRMGKQKNDDKPRPIIVKFVRYLKRSEFYQERKSVREARVPEDSRFTATMLDRVYIADCLTRHNGAIMFVARQLRKDGMIAHCWTDGGVMKVRVNVDGPTKRIRGINDLHQLVGDHAALGMSDFGIPGMPETSALPEAPRTVPSSRGGGRSRERSAGPRSSTGSPAGRPTRSRPGAAPAVSGRSTPQAGATPTPRQTAAPGTSGSGASGGRKGGRRNARGR